MDALDRYLERHADVAGIVATRLVGDLPDIEAAAGTLAVGTPFRVASNTKTFVAAAVLRLVESGELSLAAPIAPLLPAAFVDVLAEGGYETAHITVAQLLRHTSGITDFARGADGGYQRSPYEAAILADPDHRWTALEQVAFACRTFRPTGAPGERFPYSDTGYVLAAQILQAVAGEGLARAVRTLCRLDEVGLGCTWWERLEPQAEPAPPRLAPLFVGDADLGGADCSLDLWGGGGLVSTTTDLARWWRALFGGAVFDHQETLATMTGGLVPSSEGHGLAGLGLFRRRCRGRDWWGHTGYWGSAAMLDPDRDVTVAIFRNQATSPFEDLDPVVASLVAAA